MKEHDKFFEEFEMEQKMLKYPIDMVSDIEIPPQLGTFTLKPMKVENKNLISKPNTGVKLSNRKSKSLF